MTPPPLYDAPARLHFPRPRSRHITSEWGARHAIFSTTTTMTKFGILVVLPGNV